jgi:glycerate kinase
MRVLIAFDKFKDSLTAPRACAITAGMLHDRNCDWTLETCPLADGGEGFCEILTTSAAGSLQTVSVQGPRGEPTEARLGLVPFSGIPRAAGVILALPQATRANANVAVIEMAQASGLQLLPPDQRDPWQTSTTGTGQLIRVAAESGAIGVLLGVGGSATNDLGLGALAALGLESRTVDGKILTPPIPANWPSIARFQGHPNRSLPPIRIACDVTNPLLGPQGAATIYGPQKGLAAQDLPRMEAGAARLASMVCHHCRKPEAMMAAPGAGAAGGIAFGLMVAAGARLLPGFDLVSAWLDLETKIAAADLVITGEGSFDDSSLSGKGPGAVAQRALALGKPVHVFAGRVGTTHPPPRGLHLHAITPADTPLEQALREAPHYLAAAVSRAVFA